MDNRIEKRIDALVGALSDPIIVYDPGWEVPEWIRGEMPLHRLAQLMKGLKDPGEAEVASDLEAMAYLSNASLIAPMRSEWVELYMYLFTQVMTKKGTEVPEDLRREEITDYQKGLLRDFKSWLYQRRARAREERARAERRREKEEAAARAPKQLTMTL